MKALSLRQANACESATHARCRCRCGGVYHGRKLGVGREFFESLPKDDPHHLETEEERIERKHGRYSKQWNKLRQMKLPLDP
jgi:hypothetical protein